MTNPKDPRLAALLEPEHSLPLSLRIWSFANWEKPIGPFSEARMHMLLEERLITADTLVWRQGMPEWAKAGGVEPFASSLHSSADR